MGLEPVGIDSDAGSAFYRLCSFCSTKLFEPCVCVWGGLFAFLKHFIASVSSSRYPSFTNY